MKRFHNPMTLIILITLSVCFVATTIAFIAIEELIESFFVYWIIVGMLLLCLAVTAIGEYIYYKEHLKGKSEFEWFQKNYVTRVRAIVEKYASTGRNERVRPILLELNEQLMADYCLTPEIGDIDGVPCLTYYYILSDRDWIKLFDMQTQLTKTIMIRPDNRVFNVFDGFADRIKIYQNDGASEIFIPTEEPFDYEFVYDMVKFMIDQIERMRGIEGGV